jgi:mannose-6-phosphate isomerase-like protein (cupin superfamily)
MGRCRTLGCPPPRAAKEVAMSYPGDTGEVSAVFRSAAEVEQVTFATSGTVARFVAPGSTTRGRYGLFEWNMQPHSGGSGAHFHRTFSESFYITSGIVRLYNGEKWVPAHAGEFLYVPEGGIHAFRNDDDGPASMLILFAPGPPREEYFRELAAIAAAGRTLTEDEWTDLFARHDQYRAE